MDDHVTPSDVIRVRFLELDGLRAIAIAATLAAGAAHLGWLTPHNAWAAFALDAAAQSIALFLAISGFALAYPPLAVLAEERATYLDAGRFLVKRLVRIAPAALATSAIGVLAAWALPHRGFAPTALPAWLAAFVACYALFPFAVMLWTRVPLVFFGVVALAAVAARVPLTAGTGIGAFVPFALGIVAADARARRSSLGRFALPILAGALTLAWLSEPRGAALATFGHGLPRVDPFWSLAFAALLLAAVTSTSIARGLGAAPLRWLGDASYALALAAVPTAGFASPILRHAFGRAGVPFASLGAAAGGIAAGVALWAVVDRSAADPAVRREAANRAGALVDRLLALVHADRIPLGSRTGLDDAAPAIDLAGFAPPPRSDGAAAPETDAVAAEQMDADIRASKLRLAELGAALFADPIEAPTPAVEEEAPGLPPAPAAPAYDDDSAARPGIYRRSAETPPIPAPAPSPATVDSPPAAPRPIRLRIGAAQSDSAGP